MDRCKNAGWTKHKEDKHVIKDEDLHHDHDCVNDDEMMVIQQGDHRGRPAEDVQEDGPWQQWQNLKKGDFGLNLWKSELKKKKTQNLKMGDSDPFASKSSLSLIYIIIHI